MKQGRIIKVISNRCTIYCDGKEYVGEPRGRMRKGERPLVGDHVTFEQIDGSVRINSILPRKNHLLRPSVCNVDQALIVTSLKDPDFSPRLLNRLILLIVLCNITPVICITKSDLLSPDERAKVQPYLDAYVKAGYDLFYSSPQDDDEALKEHLKNRITVLCGQSGAGKSSLLNRLAPHFQLHTQEISKALGRGRHTTRHCELYPAAGGLVADTPGFSSLDFSHFDLEGLDKKIPDFQPYIEESCRFADCTHLDEPDCVIKMHVQNGDINPLMYEDYSALMREARARRKKY